MLLWKHLWNLLLNLCFSFSSFWTLEKLVSFQNTKNYNIKLSRGEICVENFIPGSISFANLKLNQYTLHLKNITLKYIYVNPVILWVPVAGVRCVSTAWTSIWISKIYLYCIVFISTISIVFLVHRYLDIWLAYRPPKNFCIPGLWQCNMTFISSSNV